MILDHEDFVLPTHVMDPELGEGASRADAAKPLVHWQSAAQHPPRQSQQEGEQYDAYKGVPRPRDDAGDSSAAVGGKYSATVTDYLIFVYFSITCFLLGCPLLNSNAAMVMWRVTNTFSGECRASNEAVSWCLEQLECAKIALVLYQSAAAATALMGGILVDTFSASMCLLIAHLMFGGGAYLLQRPGTTRGIFVACVLQGAAGDLVLNAVLPICGLFGDKHNMMVVILTLCHDLSVLVYPILLNVFAPDTLLSETFEQFFQNVHLMYCYVIFAIGFIGTFLLPVDDDGNLMPSGTLPMATVASVGKRSYTRRTSSLEEKPRSRNGRSAADDRVSANGNTSGRLETQSYGVERSGMQQSDSNLVTRNGVSGHQKPQDDEALTRLIPGGAPVYPVYDDEEYDSQIPVAILQYDQQRNSPPLSSMRLSKQLKSPQFFIALLLSCLAELRCSFFLNNNQQLLERVGDDGTLTKGFMWLLALGAVFGPISWQINDNWDTLSSLALLTMLLLSVNILAAVNSLSLQWLTIVAFVCGRSAVSSTILTYIAGCFGIERFAPISVIIGFASCFFNFFNILLDRYVEHQMQGDYFPANLFMITLGAFSVLCVVAQAFFPNLRASADAYLEHSSSPVLGSAADINASSLPNAAADTSKDDRVTYSSSRCSYKPSPDEQLVSSAGPHQYPPLSTGNQSSTPGRPLEGRQRQPRGSGTHAGALVDEDEWEDVVPSEGSGGNNGHHRRRILKSHTVSSSPSP